MSWYLCVIQMSFLSTSTEISRQLSYFCYEDLVKIKTAHFQTVSDFWTPLYVDYMHASAWNLMLVCSLLYGCICVAVSSALHKTLHHINGQGEDDGGVLLCCNCVEGLEVAKLQGGWGLGDHQRRLLQRPWRVHFTLCRDHLCKAEKWGVNKSNEQSEKTSMAWLN